MSRKVASSIDVDIVDKVVSNILLTESDEKDRQMKDQDANIPLTRFEQSFGGHVPVGDDGNDGDDDDDACSSPPSVCSYFFCLLFLLLQIVGTEDKMHVESQFGSEAEGNVDIGESCGVGRDQDKSHKD